MSFTRQVYLEVAGDKDLSLVMNYRYGESEPDSFEIHVFRKNEDLAKARWSVDAAHCALVFDPATLGASPSTGVAKCLGIAVGKGLIECLWGANGDLGKIRKGVKENAVGVLLDAAGRIADCP